MNPRSHCRPPSSLAGVSRDSRDSRLLAFRSFPFLPFVLFPVALAAALVPVPASATFHIAHIQRVMTGNDETTDVQFVEILMESAGQNLVNGSKLIAFAADGSFDHVVLTLNKNVTSGSNRPFLIASEGFDTLPGAAPDFVFDSSGGGGLLPEDGMVCWGKPGDETDPDDGDMVDCVSYGNYTGPPNRHSDAPSDVTPFGHGLVRVDSTGNSAVDFECENPALPRNNVPASFEVIGSSPCDGVAGCGDGAVDDGETCDDGDTEHVAGDHCNADCLAFGCGIPTDVDAVTPKTSDALFVLKAAVAASNCDTRVCDVNGSGTITTTDALFILRRAVGQDVELACPA